MPQEWRCRRGIGKPLRDGRPGRRRKPGHRQSAGLLDLLARAWYLARKPIAIARARPPMRFSQGRGRYDTGLFGVARMQVLVTGGAGFIGSHVVEALLARSYRVRVLDNLITGSTEYLP